VKVVIAAVGKPRDRAIASAIEDYESRARRYWTLQSVEVKAERAQSARDAARVMQQEGQRLIGALPPSALIVACAPDGRGMSSEAFAQWLATQRDRARDVAFVVGGAFGLAPEVRTRAELALSLAPWTLSHELARLVLTEQVYRAGSIVAGHPYHK
jgi:23S rRNA (pseudouridine1915-N3)-methyltransferase